MVRKRDNSKWWSIDRQIPLLIASVLLITVVAVSWTALHKFKTELMVAAGDRLLVSSEALVALLGESAARTNRQMERLTTDPGIAGLFREFPQAGLRPAARIDTTTLAALRSLDVQVHDLRGNSLPAPMDVATDTPAPPLRRSPWLDSIMNARMLMPGQVATGPLFARGDTVYVQRIIAIGAPTESQRLVTQELPSDAVVGYITSVRPISGQGISTISSLIGSDAVLLVGTAEPGAIWSDLQRPAPPPPDSLHLGEPTQYASTERGEVVGVANAIPGTPWLLWLEQQQAAVLAPARKLFRQLALLSILFVIIGATTGLVLSRRITRPLVRLTGAAERVATETAETPVPLPRYANEVDRLSNAFVRMAARVDESQHELEVRVARRTTELQSALGDLQEAQTLLLQKDRLATLGQLAGSVGHELRNPLGVITNAIHVIDHVLVEKPPLVEEYLGLVRTQVAISERIVGDLLDTTRVHEPDTQVVSLPEVIDEYLGRLGAPDSVAIVRNYSHDLPRAWVDPMQLRQIVSNLLTNAAQAMGDAGGTLTVTLRPFEVDRVRLEVHDTGSGIAPAILDNIFEPLFTTKARGLGLGLWVSRSLAEANSAKLSATSSPELGTQFVLDMPTAPVGAGVNA